MLLSLLVIAVAAAVIGIAFLLSWRTHLDIDRIGAALTGEAEERWIVGRIERHPRLRRFVTERLDRKRFAGFSLTVAFAATAGAAFVLGAVLDLVDRNGAVAAADRWVSAWGVAHADTFAVATLQRWTHLGAAIALVPAGVVVAAGSVRGRGHRRAAEELLFLAATSVGASLLSSAVKHLVDRPRPALVHLTSFGGSSFPSGHACAAAAGWAAVALVVGTDRRWTTRLGLFAVAAFVAVGVATSRALLGVHWLTDVVAGLALGWAWFLVCAVVWGGRRLEAGKLVAEIDPGLPAERSTDQGPPHARPRHTGAPHPGSERTGSERTGSERHAAGPVRPTRRRRPSGPPPARER